MSDSPISPQNNGTFTAAAFVLALLSLAFGLFTFQQVNSLAGGVAALEKRDIKDDGAAVKKAQDDLAALSKRVDELAAKAAAAPPPAPPPAPPAEGAPPAPK